MEEILKIRLPKAEEIKKELLLGLGEVLRKHPTVHCSIKIIKEGEAKEVCIECEKKLTMPSEPSS